MSNDSLGSLAECFGRAILPSPYHHQLIVLGNGFDLHCDLPSKYGNFFSSRTDTVYCAVKDAFSDGCTTWGEHLSACGLTAWDVILAVEKPIWWYNVERSIRNWVVPNRSGTNIRLLRVLACLNPSAVPAGMAADAPSEWRNYSGSPCRGYPEADVARFLTEVYPDVSWSHDAIATHLYMQLQILEVEFKKYLQGVVDNTEGYKCKAELALEAIVNDGWASNELDRVEDSVLSFNYTRPIHMESRVTHEPITYVNVHGSIDKSIVFGIDATGLLGKKSVREFTKTYRVMSMRTPDSGGIIYPNGASYFNNGTEVIKFFGHSLSSADYSYFQSLFDTVNLYAGMTKLVFYYAPHDNLLSLDEQMKRAREELMDAAINLLDGYGKTLDNTNHGRNLIHKLLLEGRLSVKPLPAYG